MIKRIRPFKTLNQFLFTSMLLTLLVLLLFAVSQWLNLEVGRFFDWLIGVVLFWWLLIIVTVPWNIYFQAKQITVNAHNPIDERIKFKPEQVEYARIWTRRSLFMAITLHLITAVGLYWLAASNVSPIGYVGSGIALLLTGLRPIIRGYEYLTERLSAIERDSRFPHANVFQLQDDVQRLKKQLDTNDQHSWITQQQIYTQTTREQVNNLQVTVDELRTINQSEHARLSREAQNAVAQLSEDGQFLSHVREIIRFVKTA